MEDLLRAAWGVLRVPLGVVGALVVAAGIAAGGLAGLVLLADWVLNEPASVSDVQLWPDLSSNVGAVGVVAILVFGLMLATGLFRASQIGLALGSGLLLAIVGVLALLAVAVVVRGWFGRDEQPQGYLSALLTIFVFAVAAGVIAFLAIAAALKNGGAIDIPHKRVFAIWFGVIVAGSALLITPPQPDPPEHGRGKFDPRVFDSPDQRFDVVLLVDPGDAAGRRLISLAGKPGGLRDTIGWNVAYGLAALQLKEAPQGKVLRHPNTNVNYLLDPLRRLGGGFHDATPPDFDAALAGLSAPGAVRWRERTRRSVVVVAESPPGLGATPPAGVRVDAVVGGGPPRARDRLARRLAPTGGKVWSARRGASALADAERAATSAVAPADHRGLAMRHRPVLEFDTNERRVPLDIAAFLAERGTNRKPAHELCRRVSKLQSGDLTYGDCRRVWEADDLRPDLSDRDGILALDVNNPAASNADEFRTSPRQRMYYHAQQSGDWLYLDYWVFYRYNDAPRFPRHTCLSGLSVKDATCFDHEGDWEGVTVVLKRTGGDGDFRPESAVYAGHHWRYRFSWSALASVGATEKQRPRVWVAKGSHASYPAPCGTVKEPGRAVPRKVSCRQPRSDIPDGARNGERDWPLNDDGACRKVGCLAPLPETRKRGPASWAGFAGHWGLPRCTVGTSLCVRSLGPDSPWFQKRYADPGGPFIDDALLAQWYPPRPGQRP